MKKIITTSLCCIICLVLFNIPALIARAAENPTATLYTTDSAYLKEEDYIDAAAYKAYCNAFAQAPQKYEFEYGDKATYCVTAGGSVTVSKTGVVEPLYTTMYYKKSGVGTYISSSPRADGYDYTEQEAHPGNSTVSVTVNGKTTNYSFEVKDYVKEYVDEKINRYIAENIKPSMTDYEKFEKAMQYAAHDYGYSVKHSGCQTMVLYGGGDCWASSYLAVEVCKRVGINARVRYAPFEGFSGHRNVAALIDGTVYIGEAGYNEPKPRYYYIRSENTGFCEKPIQGGYSLRQYDGWESQPVVPEKIDNTVVKGIESKAFSIYNDPVITKVTLPNTIEWLAELAFYRAEGLEEITIPKNVNSIGSCAFTNCSSLKAINVAKDNAYFSSDNGVLYDKKQTRLMAYPYAGTKNYTMAKTTTQIDEYAFYEVTGIEKLEVPASLKTVGRYAFYRADVKELVFHGDMPEFGENALYGLTATIYYPDGNETWKNISGQQFGGSITWKSFYEPVKITGQPEDKKATVGDSVTFSVNAIGNGLKYEWQKSTDSGKTWKKSISTGADSSALTLTAKASYNGLQFRCVMVDYIGIVTISNPATLKVEPALSITTQPASKIATAGTVAEFSVAATGSNLTYQWKKSTDGGKTWVNSSSTGAKTATLSVTTKKTFNNYMFKCVVANQNGKTVTSNAATLQVEPAFEITAQPTGRSVTAGTAAEFSVAATGSGLTYQWKKSTDGGKTWVNSSSTGAKTATLSVTTKKAFDNYMFRCVITDKDGKTVTSNVAVLTVISK